MKDTRIDQIVFSRWVFPRMKGMELSAYLALAKISDGNPITSSEFHKYINRNHSGALSRADIFMESLELVDIMKMDGPGHPRMYAMRSIENPIYINSLLNELYIMKRINGTELKALSYLQYAEQTEHDITIDQLGSLINRPITRCDGAIDRLNQKRLIQVKGDRMQTTFI